MGLGGNSLRRAEIDHTRLSPTENPENQRYLLFSGVMSKIRKKWRRRDPRPDRPSSKSTKPVWKNGR